MSAEFGSAHFGGDPQSTAFPPGAELIEAEGAVIRRAVEVIGNEPEAMRWLGTPVRTLGYATPVSLLHEAKGREQVLIVLGRLEHGIL